MTYRIVCMGVSFVLGEGQTKEEALKQVPQICGECGGKIDFSTLKWNGDRGWIHCSVSQRLNLLEAHALNVEVFKKFNEFKTKFKKELS